MFFVVLLGLVVCCACVPTSNAADDEKVVIDHVKNLANTTFRQPAGFLKYPYLAPGGPYNQLWDWDSVFMGVGLLDYGSAPYLAGSMMNFLDHTNVSTGDVQGCVTPDGSTGTIYHAKPVVIQGAWLAAKATQNTLQFAKFQPQMKALLDYWERERKHNATGLYVWHDQLESGADNLPISTCPSALSPCWNASLHSLCISSTDVMTFLYREHQAYKNFCQSWISHDTPSIRPPSPSSLSPAPPSSPHTHPLAHHIKASNDEMDNIILAINSYLWDGERGVYVAYNTTDGRQVNNNVYLMGFPLFGGLATVEQADKVVARLMDASSAFEPTSNDMLTPYGFRSTSKTDPRYNNVNEIVPYSNWRGPVWILANAVLLYGFEQYGHAEAALGVGGRVVGLLAGDVRESGTWHECYNAENGSGLAASGFLSWNTLGSRLMADLRKADSPFEL